MTQFKIIVNKYKKYYNKMLVTIRKQLAINRKYKVMQNCRPYCKHCGVFYTGIGDICIITNDMCIWV